MRCIEAAVSMKRGEHGVLVEESVFRIADQIYAYFNKTTAKPQ